MANFHIVNPLYWTEIALEWPERARLLGMWLQSNEHRNLEGLYRLPYGYIGADLGWLPKQVDEHMTFLLDVGFAFYDARAQLVLVPECLYNQQPKGKPQITGAIAKLRKLPRSELLVQLYDLARGPRPDRGGILAEGLARAMEEAFGLGIGTSPDTPSDTPSTLSAQGSEEPLGVSRERSPSPSPSPSPFPRSPTEPPTPPVKQRRTDLDRFKLQMEAWRSSSRPSSEEEERWTNALAVLGERLEPQRGGILLEHLHLHGSPNGRLVLGVAGGVEVGWIEQRLGRHLADVVGSYQLVQCGCEVGSA